MRTGNRHKSHFLLLLSSIGVPYYLKLIVIKRFISFLSQRLKNIIY
ncbi:hypothetical protein ASZ90_006919 [hydrocarbon metagenome]|uniref:Uncharacterized protein n=1 Tax=hydrocarbon metagenome TaxID=938273 RepID=A0A0W8FQQ7_9ZZZZ